MKKYKNIISTVLVITLVSQANVFAKDSFEVQELQSNRQSIIKNFEENVDIKNINNSIKKEQFINKKVYNAPVKIIHAYEEGKLSMVQSLGRCNGWNCRQGTWRRRTKCQDSYR
ncbi:hypothetical protein, partial [Peptoniphilus rhinitidis]|uniref:hypothetical protein n=1 Tax=Peptoniphilus rhinitidis TaxID=1175452 RepID=UPI00291234B7